jgi:hypothetical protein
MGLVCSLGLALLLCLPRAIAASGVLLWLSLPLTEVLDLFYVNLLLSATITGLIIGRLLPGQYVQAPLLILGSATLVTLASILLDHPTGMRTAELFELHTANLHAIHSDLITNASGLLLGAWIGSRRPIKATSDTNDQARPGTTPPADA